MWFRIMPRQTKMTQQCKQQAQTLKLKLESFGKQLPMPNLEYIAILWEYHQLYNYEAYINIYNHNNKRLFIKIFPIGILPEKRFQLTVPFYYSDDRHCMVGKYNFDLQMLFYFSYYYLETFFD